MSDCLEPGALRRFAAGEMDAEERAEAAAHLADCERCAALLPSTSSTQSHDRGAERSLAGRSIGPYRIVQRVGEGGFGEVYEAEQTAPIQRRVALKILKPGMDSRQILTRFENERQILAWMQHPNIAAVHDAGCAEDGRPYLVMEYVPGLPITEHCDRHRLGLEDRLALFVQVCDAVQHAHQKGIIHRDLKPSNVLVAFTNGKAVPKVIDFGVAKALDRPLSPASLFTLQGQVIGTLAYMSPEQADRTAQDIDTRADVYSLGVLLYELITGGLPFDPESLQRAAYDEIRHLIRNVDPERPSTRLDSVSHTSLQKLSDIARNRRADPRTLTRQVRGDLDWITMRCLEKDRSRRYAGASELAGDIRRHLANEPVLAGPPSVSLRVRKFVRRHRGALAAASVGGAVLLAGLVAVTILSVDLWRSNRALAVHRARELASEARFLGYQHQHRSEARRRLAEAVRLAPSLDEVQQEEIHQDVLAGDFTAAKAKAREVLERNPALGEARAVLAALTRQDDPAESKRLLDAAPEPVPEAQLLLATALVEPDPAKAIEDLDRSLELSPWSFDAVWLRASRRFDQLDFAAALVDAELLVKVRGDLALAWTMKGAVLSELPGRATDAIASLDRAIEIDPGDSIPWFDRAWARKKSGDLPAALADAEQAEKLAPTSGENAFLVAGVRFDRAARAWATTRDLDGARAEWRLTVERCARATELGAPEPLKVSLLEARALTSLQEYSRATGVYTAALALAKPGSNQSVDVLNGLGVSHLNERRLDDAEADFRKALSIYGPERGLLANLGKCALVRGRYDEARARYGEALGKDPSWATAKLGRGIASWLGGQLDPAVADLTAASLEKGFEWVPFWVWEIEEERGSSKAAAAALERAQALAGSVASPTYVALIAYLRGEKSEDDVLSVVRNDIDRLNALYYLGAAAWARGRHEEARALFQKTIALHFPDQLEHVLAEAHLRRAP